MMIIDWENYSSEECCCQLTRLDSKTGNTYPLHTHRAQAEIMVVTGGTISHRMNGKSQPLTKETALFIGESDRHSLDGGDGSLVNIAFSTGELSRLPDPGKGPVQLRQDALSRFNEYAGELERARGADRFLLWEFLLWYSRLSRRGMTDRPGEMPEWFGPMLAHWERNSAQSREELLASASKSEEHISRCFRKYLSCTPGDYLNRLRISAAQGLLLSTRYGIAHIAMECGYESLSYFYRIFKEETGMAPGEYRKRERVNPYLAGE